MIAGPVFVGSIVNTAPNFFILWYSFWTSSTSNAVKGILSSKSAVWKVLAAGFWFGSRSSSAPSGSSGETTVSQLYSPNGMSFFFYKT